MSVCMVRRVQWALGPAGGDANMCVRQRVQGHHNYGGNSVRVAYAPFDMMSPPLESALLPLECALLDTVQ